jgi:hypothetical protein
MFLYNLIKKNIYRKACFSLVIILFMQSSHGYITVGEKITTKLLYKIDEIADVSVKNAIADYRYLILSRGSSDGIYENDHFSFYKNNKFAFRGIVVKSDLYQSMWLTYHNYTPAILEINSDFIAKKLHLGHVPKRVLNVKNVIYANVEDLYNQFMNKKSMSGYNIDNYNGGSSNDLDNDVVKILDKNDVFEFNPNLELEEIVKASQSDIDYFSWSISASPISFSRVPQTKDIGYSLGITCLFCVNTTFDFTYSYTHSTEKPAKSEFSSGNEASVLTSSSYFSSVDYSYNNLWGDVSYWASLSWSRARTADVFENEPIFSPDYLWSGIPFGLSYNFISTDKIPELSLSYGIQWDYERVSFIDFIEDINGDFVESKVNQETQKTRHSIKIYINWLPFENFNLTNTFWYKPLHDFSNKEFDWRDSGPFTNDLSISYQTSLDISLTYTNAITWDVVTKERDGTPSTNMINSFEVTYNFNF